MNTGRSSASAELIYAEASFHSLKENTRCHPGLLPMSFPSEAFSGTNMKVVHLKSIQKDMNDLYLCMYESFLFIFTYVCMDGYM